MGSLCAVSTPQTNLSLFNDASFKRNLIIRVESQSGVTMRSTLISLVSALLLIPACDKAVSVDASSDTGCEPDTWDDDGDVSTPCVPLSICQSGTYATVPGDSRHDRVCVRFPAETYSEASNKESSK